VAEDVGEVALPEVRVRIPVDIGDVRSQAVFVKEGKRREKPEIVAPAAYE
jgi:hypothetical protein